MKPDDNAKGHQGDDKYYTEVHAIHLEGEEDTLSDIQTVVSEMDYQNDLMSEGGWQVEGGIHFD